MRTIKTARSIAKINEAVADGFYPLIQPVTPNLDLKIGFLMIQNKQTGSVRVHSGAPSYGNYIRLEEHEEIVYYEKYYPYHRRLPIAAYLLPPDLKCGERVVLNDLIQDIVSSTHNGHPYRLNSCEAVWNEVEFALDEDSFQFINSVG